MPHVLWRFEHELLRVREGPRADTDNVPRRTFICGIERDPRLYKAALAFMPGAAFGITEKRALGEGRWSVGSKLISRFHCCSLSEYLDADDVPIDGAWLDFNGPVGTARAQEIARLWKKVRRRLVVTSMRGRWDSDAALAIEIAGSPEWWLQQQLPGAQLIGAWRYSDDAPFIQAAYDRRGADDA